MKDIKASWVKLRQLGNSRLVRSNYLWIMLIPIFARVFQSLNVLIERYFGLLEIQLRLPFTWQILFFSSLAFACGSLTYQLFCPSIVKDHDNFADFTMKGKAAQHMIDYYRDQATSFSSGLSMKALKDMLSEQYDSKSTDRKDKDVVHLKQDGSDAHYVDVDKSRKLYWYIYGACNNDSPLLYAVSFSFFALGILGVSYILIQNVLFVISVSSDFLVRAST